MLPLLTVVLIMFSDSFQTAVIDIIYIFCRNLWPSACYNVMFDTPCHPLIFSMCKARTYQYNEMVIHRIILSANTVLCDIIFVN